MLDDLRDTLRTLGGRLDPDERRRMANGMRDALVHAKLALQDLRTGLGGTESRLAAEQAELDTVRRRMGYAADIGDNETVAIAERFAAQHAERVAMLESKRMSQQQELSLAERDYDTMTAELRRIMSGMAPGGATPEEQAQREVDALFTDGTDAPLDLSDTPPPSRRSRAEREADAEARLADLKRKFGK